MKKIGIILLLLAFGLGSCKDDSGELSLSVEEQDVFDHVNVYRESLGLADLVYEPVIQKQTQIHSQQMANGTVAYSHEGFSGRAATIKGEIGGSNAAESIAMDVSSTYELMTLWRNNSTDNGNLTGDFTHAAIAIATASDGTKYYTMIFLKLGS